MLLPIASTFVHRVKPSMEEEQVVILDLDQEPFKAFDANSDCSDDVDNLDVVEPFTSPASTDPFDIDVVTESIEILEHKKPPLALCLDETGETRSDAELASQNLRRAAIGVDNIKIEYASALREVPEYKDESALSSADSVLQELCALRKPQAKKERRVASSRDDIWHYYDENDISWLPAGVEDPLQVSPKKRKICRKKGRTNSCDADYGPRLSTRWLSAQERLDVARYASMYGVNEAADHFSEMWGKPVSRKVAATALEKYVAAKKATCSEPTVEEMHRCNKFTDDDRIQMAMSCQQIGPTRTAKLFSEKLGKIISESSVRGFAKKFVQGYYG